MDKAIIVSKAKKNMIEGVRTGLLVFVICFVISLMLSVVFNLTIMEFLKDAMLGAIGESGATHFGTVIKLTSVVMSFSVFSSLAGIKLGVLFFALIPFVAFYIAENKENRLEGFKLWNLLTYMIASVVFSVLINILMMLTKGELLGVKISFVSFRNVFTTLIISLIIQLIIGLNYNKNARSYIKATRMLFRMFFGIGTILALIGLIKLLSAIPLGILGKVGAIVVLLPNFLVYKSFLLLGNDIRLSDDLSKWVDKVAGLQISFQELNTSLSLLAIITWMVIVVIALHIIDQKRYFTEMGLFALTFSIISTFVAFCTSTYLGEIMLVGEISIGISLIYAFLVPLISIGALGSMVWMIRKMIKILKEI